MKSSYMTSKLLAALSAAALSFAAPLASAITITADSLVGSWAPGSAYNNDDEVAIGANKLIIWENGGVNPNPDPAAVFTLGAGFAFDLPTPAAFVAKDDAAPFVGVDNTMFSYALGKYGNESYLHYLGNLAPGIYEFPSDGPNGNGLSHVVWFSPTPPGDTPGVPDGGATVALFGLGLSALGLVRRKLK